MMRVSRSCVCVINAIDYQENMGVRALAHRRYSQTKGAKASEFMFFQIVNENANNELNLLHTVSECVRLCAFVHGTRV